MQKRIKRNILFFCTLALLLSTAVYGENPSWHAGGASAPPASIIKKARLTKIQQIIDHQEDFIGKNVTVRGVFRGWKKNCTSSSMLKRSDWVLEDETGCIYVTGRIPSALSPMQPMGEMILVKGRVISTKKGAPAIKASRITLHSK
jgi:hypothetical protein